MTRQSAIDSFTEIATLRIELNDSDPLIWRELEVPTSITLKVLHAIVQTDPDAIDDGETDADDLRNHLGDRLVRYKVPRSFEFVTEPLRDEAGKVRRSQLRADRVTPTPTPSQEIQQ